MTDSLDRLAEDEPRTPRHLAVVGADDLPEPFGFPSIMHGLPFETYRDIEALNAHGAATLVEKSPAHFKQERRVETRAMALGTLAHELILEPDKGAYIVLPEDAGRTSIASRIAMRDAILSALGVPEPQVEPDKAQTRYLDAQLAILEDVIAQQGRYVVKAAEFATAQRMADAVRSHPFGFVFDDGYSEVTCLAKDPETGCPLKIRIDWDSESHGFMLDLKTTVDASSAEYRRAAGRYDYQDQAWLYPHVRKLNGADKAFIHVVVESVEPHGVKFVMFGEESLNKGKVRIKRAMEIYQQCAAEDRWPNYPPEIEVIDVSRWA